MGTNGEPEHNLMIGENDVHLMQIDPRRSRFPCCIVWTPLPVLSWFLPCIGHIGICREDGVILDFAGPNFVCVDNFSFGAPTRFVQISKEKCFTIANSAVHDSNDEIERIDLGRDIVTWDDALRKSTQEYQHHSYNIFTCNCHSFVANGLNRLKFQAGGWNVVNLAVFIFLKGQWVSKAAIVRTYLPFIIVLALGLTFGGWMFLTYLATFLFVLVGWFFLGSYCFKKFINL
ncbi:protein RTE1-HOMOLOG [Olea europaea var. sylvestris]|uniref:protein RTE1-HOMOLOG n=1 Tax=Olea europaea var. sylvestris TaxID=158386 RepID=UPI000C1CCE0A|nr:protein RTE1-HOMOLOG [Olea europaea var. sylvestris]